MHFLNVYNFFIYEYFLTNISTSAMDSIFNNIILNFHMSKIRRFQAGFDENNKMHVQIASWCVTNVHNLNYNVLSIHTIKKSTKWDGCHYKNLYVEISKISDMCYYIQIHFFHCLFFYNFGLIFHADFKYKTNV